MKEISKKAIRENVEAALGSILRSLKIAKASKKTRNIIKKAAKKYSDQLKAEIKKQGKKKTPKQKLPKKASPPSRAPGKGSR